MTVHSIRQKAHAQSRVATASSIIFTKHGWYNAISKDAGLLLNTRPPYTRPPYTRPSYTRPSYTRPSVQDAKKARPSSGSSSRKGKQKGGKPRASVTLKDLVDFGVILPGRNKISVTYKGINYLATLGKDGIIVYQGEAA